MIWRHQAITRISVDSSPMDSLARTWAKSQKGLKNSTWLKKVQYIPKNMHTVFALLCFVVVIHWLIFPYPSDLLHWHCGNLTIAPVPAKQHWWIWINTSREFIMNDCITTTKQSTTKPWAYFVGYTVRFLLLPHIPVANELIYLRAFKFKLAGLYVYIIYHSCYKSSAAAR